MKKKSKSKTRRHTERLEWLGDALLQFLSSRFLFERYPNLSEGELTLARESLVSGRALAAAARNCGLAKRWVGGEMSDTVIAGKTEKYFAECYLDGDLSAADEIVREVLDSAVAELENKIAAGITLKEPKTALQEITQSSGTTPTYTLHKKIGKPHNFHFWVECRATDSGGKEVCTIGDGKTLLAAEQQAAEKCAHLLTHPQKRESKK